MTISLKDTDEIFFSVHFLMPLGIPFHEYMVSNRSIFFLFFSLSDTPCYTMGGKRVNFKIGIIFDWMESFLLCLCSNGWPFIELNVRLWQKWRTSNKVTTFLLSKKHQNKCHQQEREEKPLILKESSKPIE